MSEKQAWEMKIFQETIEVAKFVRKGASSNMDKFYDDVC
jgi:hypothetical protein